MSTLAPDRQAAPTRPRRLIWFLSCIPAAASGIAVIVGSLVLIGWLGDVELLRTFSAGPAAMNPITAIALVLTGCSLWLLQAKHSDRHASRIGRILAGTACGIGVARLLGYLAGSARGIDTLLFANRLEIAPGAWRDRMAPNSAVLCVLLGASLALIDVTTKRVRRPFQHLAVAATMISLVALTGYAYAARPRYGFSGDIGMAFHTAATFLVLGIGVLCARSEEGLVGIVTRDTPGGLMTRRLMPAIFGIPVLLGWLRLAGERAGLYDTSTGTALLVIATVIVLATLVYASAMTFDRADAERRRAEANTKDARMFLDSIVENVPNMVFVKDAVDLRFVRFNKAGESLLGVSREELIGKNDFDFFPKSEADFFIAKDRAALASGGVIEIPEEPIQTRHQGRRLLHTKKVAIPDSSGRPAYLLGISEDISEHKAAEAERQRHRAVFESLFESLPGPYLVLSPDLEIVTANNAYLKATMTKREELRGRDLFEAFPDNPDDPNATGTANLRASLDRVRASSAPDTMAIQKYDVRQPDGTFVERYWSPINSPVLGADGRIEYILHRVEDVTEFVRMRSHPEDGPDALRTRMEQMESEIFRSSQQVQAASSRLEAANKELESFTYSVSHDLRAPLRHINGFADLLVQRSAASLDATGRRYLDKIRTGAARMGVLIDELLSFSKMSRTALRSSRVSLRSIVDDVIADLTELTDGRSLEWRVGGLPEVEADPSMLRQVFANLVGNAVKYTGTRAHTVIEIGTLEGNASEVVVFVRDNGVGFDMQYADKLFGVFQRLHRADEFEGTGIGLANVRRIVERHGGRTWAEGGVDRGAIFYFSLPAHREATAWAS